MVWRRQVNLEHFVYCFSCNTITFPFNVRKTEESSGLLKIVPHSHKIFVQKETEVVHTGWPGTFKTTDVQVTP